MDPAAQEPALGILGRYWWLMAFRGLIIAVYGILVFLWPEMTTIEFVTLFSLYACVAGILSVILGLRAQNMTLNVHAFILPGIVSTFIGLFVYFLPGLSTLALIGLVGIWSIFIGLMELLLAIQMRKTLVHDWSLLGAGILAVVSGGFLLLHPLYVVFWNNHRIGTSAILVGTTLIILAIRMRRVKEVTPSILRYRKS